MSTNVDRAIAMFLDIASHLRRLEIVIDSLSPKYACPSRVLLQVI